MPRLFQVFDSILQFVPLDVEGYACLEIIKPQPGYPRPMLLARNGAVMVASDHMAVRSDRRAGCLTNGFQSDSRQPFGIVRPAASIAHLDIAGADKAVRLAVEVRAAL